MNDMISHCSTFGLQAIMQGSLPVYFYAIKAWYVYIAIIHIEIDMALNASEG